MNTVNISTDFSVHAIVLGKRKNIEEKDAFQKKKRARYISAPAVILTAAFKRKAFPKTEKGEEKEEAIKKKTSHLAHNKTWQDVEEENGSNRTKGVVNAMKPGLEKTKKKAQTYLCSSSVDHIVGAEADLGWGCGYRNSQMLMSFLESHESDDQKLLKQVPDLPGLQLLIEKAWKEGFDSSAAKEFDNTLSGTNKWIGTTDVYTLLAYLGIRSTILDFYQTNDDRTYDKLMDWVQAYFTNGITTEAQSSESDNVHITNKPPLYLQHQGHSRTIIGIETLDSGKRNLILFDPGQRASRAGRKKKNAGPEIPAALLRPNRVNGKALSANYQYQILALGQLEQADNGSWQPNYMLTDEEREEAKKNITYFVM